MALDRAISKVIETNGAGTYNLYTCPPNCRAKLPLVFITNGAPSGNATFQLKWFRKQDDKSYFIIGGKNLGVGEFVQLSEGYVVFEPEDRFDIVVTAGTRVDALCTAEETFLANISRTPNA